MKAARILMVEDEENVLSINRSYLESQGYETISAATLEQARHCIEEYLPDLILLDVMLPDGMGWDFCESLRNMTNAPVIYLTCRNEHESVVKGFLRGGDDYVIKPYDLKELSLRIAAQLRRAGNLSAGRIDLPPLSINLLTNSVVLDGENIQLTQKELQLLYCFASSLGKRFTAEELYSQIWGSAAENVAKTISVHINNLKQKLRLNEVCAFELNKLRSGEYAFSKIKY